MPPSLLLPNMHLDNDFFVAVQSYFRPVFSSRLNYMRAGMVPLFFPPVSSGLSMWHIVIELVWRKEVGEKGVSG